MTILLDRLREALGPEYEVERELASGGMGMVFLGRDVALDRRVAIKIMRPELATARSAERFVREARALASVTHPSIVPVHRAGQSGGFSFYVMEYIEAETLADRLKRAPLSTTETVQAGLDLLDALEAVHRVGVVHRDIKPSNIFLVERRAMLVDFGVAKLTGRPETTITASGQVIGTLAFMPPEQLDGAEVSPRSDLYALAMVLYQALTGRGWPLVQDLDDADWSGVARRVRQALRGALAWSAEARYADAGAFRRALAAARPERRRFRAAPVAGALLGAAAVFAGYLLLTRRPPGPAVIAIERLEQHGAPNRPWLGDSLARAVAREMGANPDFLVRGPGDGHATSGRVTQVLAGYVQASGDSLRVVVHSRPGQQAEAIVVRAVGAAAAWPELADSLARTILAAIWSAGQKLLASELPTHALPKTTAGMAAFVAAERQYAHARWDSAYGAYLRAIALDSTCLLCDWRIADVRRWLVVDQDPAPVRRYLAAIDSFTPNYRRLIEASVAPRRHRWDKLRQATERDRGFAPAWFARGDELFHRGPLDGYRRRDALEPLERATVLRPDFAPAWEHLAWVAIAEGDTAGARRAMNAYASTTQTEDPFSLFTRALLEVGFAWRFQRPAEAEALTRSVLGHPMIRGFPDLGAAPRYLLTFDAPRGVVWLGEVLAHWSERPELRPSGLLAQVYGLLALGKADSARAVARALSREASDPEYALVAAELGAALVLLDSADVARAWPSLREALHAPTVADAGSDAQRRRAAWMLALLARRAGAGAEAPRYRALLSGEPAPRALSRLLDADEAALAGDVPRALSLSDTLLSLDSAARAGDPFFRTVLHLMRAQWWADTHNLEAAVRELRWHENGDFAGSGSPAPQAGEIDWAFGTIGRFRRAGLLSLAGRTGDELCACTDGVARLWAEGDPLSAARARSARERLATMACPPRP